MKETKSRSTITLRADIAEVLQARSGEMQMTPNHLANLLLESSLQMMTETGLATPQVVTNYRRMTGRELGSVPDLMWKLLSLAVPSLERKVERNITETESIFVELWNRVGGCETEGEAAQLWKFAVERNAAKTTKEKALKASSKKG